MMEFIDDYFEFMDKWNAIKNDRVLFIAYSDYLYAITHQNNDSLINRIEHFINKKRKSKLMIPNRVKCSDTFTNERYNYYINKEYMRQYTKENISKIEKRRLKCLTRLQSGVDAVQSFAER